jgi:hypothetical protein
MKSTAVVGDASTYECRSSADGLLVSAGVGLGIGVLLRLIGLRYYGTPLWPGSYLSLPLLVLLVSRLDHSARYTWPYITLCVLFAYFAVVITTGLLTVAGFGP